MRKGWRWSSRAGVTSATNRILENSPRLEPRPLAVVTCGPAYESIDGVRRLTNFATGEIGAILSAALQECGYDVICFRGEGSTSAEPTGVEMQSFSTNDSLAQALQTLPRQPNLILHAAALCDFKVAAVEGADSKEKISSRKGGITIHLQPAPKILPQLREWFPQALIVGWKYELDGQRADAIESGARQLRETGSDVCVLNGKAYGEGFGILFRDLSLRHCSDKKTLAQALIEIFDKN